MGKVFDSKAQGDADEGRGRGRGRGVCSEGSESMETEMDWTASLQMSLPISMGARKKKVKKEVSEERVVEDSGTTGGERGENG